jgi:hypothetical protein
MKHMLDDTTGSSRSYKLSSLRFGFGPVACMPFAVRLTRLLLYTLTSLDIVFAVRATSIVIAKTF